MLSLLLLAASMPDAGLVQHGVTYRLGIQAIDSGPDVTTFASTIEGSVRIVDRVGVEAILGALYIATDDLFGEPTWRFGNPLLRAVFADVFGQLRFRASTGVAFPLARDSEVEGQHQVDRSGFASASARSGGRDLWLWAPHAVTWLTTARIEQPIGVINLGLDAQAMLLVQGKARFGGSLGGDVAVRPIEQLEIGVRVQGAGMATKGERLVSICIADDPTQCGFDPSRQSSLTTEDVLENDRPNLSLAPWIAGQFGFFSAMVRFTLNLSDTLGFEQLGGPFYGFDVALGVAF